LVEKIKKEDPESGAEAGKILAAGKKIGTIFQKAFSAGARDCEDELKSLKQDLEKLSATPFELKKLQTQFEKGKARREDFERQAASGIKIQVKGPDFDLNGPHPFFIGNLAPSKHWTVMVDETGDVFDQSCFEKGISQNARGRLAAILIPDESDLPKIKSFHATDSDTADVAEKLDKLLHTKVPSGIIGVSLDGMAKVQVNYWYNGLERLFDLILRMLPLDDSATRLDIYVEKRDTRAGSENMVQLCADGSLYRLAKADAARAQKIKIIAKTLAKKTTKDQTFIAYNGYVDSWYDQRLAFLESFAEVLKNPVKTRQKLLSK